MQRFIENDIRMHASMLVAIADSTPAESPADAAAATPAATGSIALRMRMG